MRLLKILRVVLRHGLEEFVLVHPRLAGVRRAYTALGLDRRFAAPRAVRLREALQDLGPIFVKFGQALSTRRDLLPPEYADELAKLQDRVPPFPGEQAVAIVERELGKPVSELFGSFEREAAASASVAQVHFATLPGGRAVAVKVLRPAIGGVIAKDVSLLKVAAGLVERVSVDGRRLRPREVVVEFEKHLEDELDLMREAANCSQLRRNFEGSPLLRVPEVHWDWCSSQVMVMERMFGTPIAQVDRLREQGIDIPALANAGVEIFFTQVFRDAYFHADMHPGNILITGDGKYIALDFGIMGTLSEEDQQYLAVNFLAFFRRDYRRVATAHIESGWVPRGTRVDELEAAVRSVCEPVFDKPLKDISLGQVLLQLFRASRRFNVEIQPQLVMLQKTLLGVEGLGRMLYPELDLWRTAKPYLERWMRDQFGLEALGRHVEREAPHWARTLPMLPRLVHQALEAHIEAPSRSEAWRDRFEAERRRARWLAAALAAVAFVLAVQSLFLLLA